VVQQLTTYRPFQHPVMANPAGIVVENLVVQQAARDTRAPATRSVASVPYGDGRPLGNFEASYLGGIFAETGGRLPKLALLTKFARKRQEPPLRFGKPSQSPPKTETS
jgi:hypothetical protein